MRVDRREVARAFGAALRAARTEQGISQAELSARCGFDHGYPSALERGLRGPTVATLLRLAKALDVEPERLVADTVARLQDKH